MRPGSPDLGSRSSQIDAAGRLHTTLVRGATVTGPQFPNPSVEAETLHRHGVQTVREYGFHQVEAPRKLDEPQVVWTV